MAAIVLLTDFGFGEYVGVMKGLLARFNPHASVIDLCHDVSPQNCIEAAWLLKNNYKFFPDGSIFCCVVDPGVGTARRALAVKTENYYFVAPDNGLLWETLQSQNHLDFRELPIPPDASATFHGRDVFAPAAAHISLGRFDDLGPQIETIEKFTLPLRQREGIITRIDHFGNIITNLPKTGQDKYTVETENQSLSLNFYPNYASAPPNQLFLIEGSCQTLEISQKNTPATNQLPLPPGAKIKIT